MALQIRAAQASDIQQLCDIERAAFAGDRLSRKSFRRLIASRSAALPVARFETILAGYCVVLFRRNGRSARLYSLAVAPAFAGQGIARALLAAAEREASDHCVEAIRLEVREDNGRAIDLYRRAGFRPVARISEYYQDGACALRMEKPLRFADADPGITDISPSTGRLS